jgi:UbiA prenyltransferase family
MKINIKVVSSDWQRTSMAAATLPAVSAATLLKLGRVSNLPTVWTNVLSATVLAGAAPQGWRFGAAVIAMSLFYLGGMFLNDYFDRGIDAHERPERPIPAGDVSSGTVAAIGFGLLAAGIFSLAATGLMAALTGVLLSAFIVVYDRHHKDNPFAPIVMGTCRALVYGGAAAAVVDAVPVDIIIAGGALLAYIAGVTYAARQESLDRVGNVWPLALLLLPLIVALPITMHSAAAAAIYILLLGCIVGAVYQLVRRPMPGTVSRVVGFLLAGISLVDATFLAGAGAVGLALLAITGFGATLVLQKYIAGT